MPDAVRAPLEILVVEDDAGDLLMLTEALDDAGPALPPRHVHVARDGAEALEFLHRRGVFAHAPTPDLVLLDLNLPKLGGYDVLESVKTDPLLTRIPVVVLSTSDSVEDVLRSYGAHANAFITKPVDFDALAAAVRAVVHTFGVVATLPPRAH